MQKSYQNLHDYVHDLINKLREAYTKLNQHKYEYQMKYKSYYDKKQKDITFKIDDKVMVYFRISLKSAYRINGYPNMMVHLKG